MSTKVAPRDPAVVPIARSKFSTLGGVLTSAPAITTTADGVTHLYVLGSNGALYQKLRTNGVWSPSITDFKSMGGKFVGTPVVVSTGVGKVDIFVLGSDKSIYHKYCTNGTDWLPGIETFNKIGGNIQASDLTAIAWRGAIYIFVRSALDNAVYCKFSPDNNWSSTQWQLLGGNITGNISAVSWGPERLDLFARETATSSVIHKTCMPGTNGWWPVKDWESLGQWSTTNSDPVGATWGPGRVDVFLVGKDKKLYTKWWDGKWNPSQIDWFTHEGEIGEVLGKPSAVGWGGNRVDVYTQGAEGSVSRKSLRGTTWDWALEFSNASQGVKADLGPVVNPIGAEKPDVFIRGSDQALWSWQQ